MSIHNSVVPLLEDGAPLLQQSTLYIEICSLTDVYYTSKKLQNIAQKTEDTYELSLHQNGLLPLLAVCQFTATLLPRASRS